MSSIVKRDPLRLMTLEAIRERFSDGTWNYEDRDWLFHQAENRPAARLASDDIREGEFLYRGQEEPAAGIWECARYLRMIAAELRDLNDSVTLTWNALESLKTKLEEKFLD